MNPALLLVTAVLGTAMLLVGIFAAVFGWLPMAPAIALAAVGLAVETAAMLAFVRTRRRPGAPDPQARTRR
jgi:CHASE2 domain-containing sensor protein